MEPLLERSRNAATLRKHKRYLHSLMFCPCLFCLYLYLRLFSIWFSILFSLSKPFYMRPPCFNVHGCCNDEKLFTKQTLQISSKPGTSWVSQKYLGSKDFKSYLKTFLMIQHLYKMTNELYTNMIYLSFLFNQDSILISVN